MTEAPLLFFYDTETTGLVKDDLPDDHPVQPHIVQLGALLTHADGTEISSLDVIIKPEGWTIPNGAAAVHKITTAIATQVGVPLISALSTFMAMRNAASIAVAHNDKFDVKVINSAMAKLGRKPSKPWPTRYCTMDAATPIINLPPSPKMRAAGFNKPKPPRLSECFTHFFNEELDGAHNAMVDVRGCARVYRHLMLLARQERDALTVG